ncbi:unnamed protein product [Brassica oleracea]|uniref:(rape) hypothetical protein n=1 Tax=Brassica napus TaxID=3708 RepID=A0A816QH80_BRANA|nr:unnamed protein product [Brassica napus]
MSPQVEKWRARGQTESKSDKGGEPLHHRGSLNCNLITASKNEIFSELEPLDRGGGLGGAGDGDGGSNGGNVVMWVFPFQRLWRRISS